ncbi:glucose-1-phosphate cytidylyltransferase [Candidatus Kaiserbacteria bacterium RIFCSPHIGHO2_02_FULL_49_34]|uniref:Glucose-1-phosphate cytidylyltransferase n=1 Tax=Candidatus Kaiserbacteria bacterium RIFCSPHIGHO2_02_FULL_49_34 TaxID=1798491 RepID=A0A1F6DI92_9BACT|nr:MAG: glucose-1-phosphate cytidylyltransferase [Candidatus Kaiserbacteria bacterium RIFCSPHIGHO2_02_FULL_49_34]
MKVVILAGGLGTRLSEETHVRPKPMVEIGGMPILWHIMKIYSHYGFNDFIICLGYKGEVIKDWFLDYRACKSDLTIDFATGGVRYHDPNLEPWRVSLIDTGATTMTGGRLARLREHIAPDERFMMTYGDGVGDINIAELVRFHESHGRLATLTTIVPEGRFGVVDINNDNIVSGFSEKTDNQKRVNGGFFVLEGKVLDYLTEGDATIFEQAPLRTLATEGQLASFAHNGFWHPMDTLSDKQKLEAQWEKGAPWKLWKE